MYGAVIGDIIGSVHEFAGTKTKAFDLFVEDSGPTDDTVCTAALAEALLTGADPAATLRRSSPRRPKANGDQSSTQHPRV